MCLTADESNGWSTGSHPLTSDRLKSMVGKFSEGSNYFDPFLSADWNFCATVFFSIIVIHQHCLQKAFSIWADVRCQHRAIFSLFTWSKQKQLFEGLTFIQQIRAIEKVFKKLWLAGKKAALHKSHVCFDHVNRLIVLLFIWSSWCLKNICIE